MKAAREERLESDVGRRAFPTKHVLLVLAIIAVGGALWQSIKEQSAEVVPDVVVVEAVGVEPPPLPSAEDIPLRPKLVIEATAEAPVEPVPTLPALAESDAMVREQLSAAGVGVELGRLEQQQNLIQQGVALIDGFSRGLVLRKLLHIAPPKEAFSALEQDEQVFMNPAGYSRYNGYAEAIARLDIAVLVNNFHTMRRLYEQAYGQLGLNPDDFDNAVIRMFDHVLATPEIEEPIAITRQSVMYQYADPQLEQMTPMQKQLLRMGPDNIRRIKEQARTLRAGLLSQQ